MDMIAIAFDIARFLSTATGWKRGGAWAYPYDEELWLHSTRGAPIYFSFFLELRLLPNGSA
jgi:hypothetical protein